MRKLKALSRDTRQQEQPEGTYPFGKNGIQDYLLGSTFNEPGFLPSSSTIPYVPIGVLDTDDKPVILSTDNTNSAIGFYDRDTDSYIPVLDDKNLSFKIGFSTNRYITGQTQRNYKQELIAAFTDKFLPPFCLNLTNPQVSTLNDMLLFQKATSPTLSASLDTGGTLLPGAYYAAAKLMKQDGTQTGYLTISSPRVVQGTSGVATDQALRVDISDMDPDYDFLVLAIISRVNGVTTTIELARQVPIVGNGSVLYTGAELTNEITLDEVLIPAPVYSKVSTIAQLNDALYLMGLESEPQINMQKYVNLIRLRWHSSLTTVNPPNTGMASGDTKSLMHQEVYDFYIRFKTGSTITDAFHIPGPPLTSQDLGTSMVASAEGLTALVFQAEDTIPSFDTQDKSGYMGKWQNATETYPDTADYDSSTIGGENLRKQPVRHHRLPSISWCKQNLYQGEPGYGKDKLDMLGISVENVIIPSQYANQITGWEILYAKRTIGNSTVLGQSLLLFGARSYREQEYSPATLYSTGGNWNSELAVTVSDPGTLLIDQSIFRFHAFDTLFNNPSLAPDYLSLQLKTSRQNIGTDKTAFIEDSQFQDGGPASGPIVYCLDYIQKGSSPSASGQIKAVSKTEYIPNNSLLDNWQNVMGERCFGGRITHPEHLLPATEISKLSVEYNSKHHAGVATNSSQSAQAEYTWLTNLMALRKDLYVPFTGQSLVRAASTNNLNDSTIFYEGDTYISDYSFHTYGWWKNNAELDGHTSGPFKGTKVVRRFICETAANLYSRYEDPSNQYSDYYPKSPLTWNDPDNYLTNFQRDQDPNQFGYTKDSGALDDLISSAVYNTYQEDITSHPYRIHRGGKLSRQSKLRSWRTFLPLDYYEMQKNMGPIVHGEGMDDRLLIHCQNALFVTRDKTQLETDLISVTLGSGDIFQFEPQESLSSPRGYAGTQHDLSCIRTPEGYVFIDSEMGQLFLYKGELMLMNGNMNTFFQQFLRLKEANVFTGNGYTVGYDPVYKRILVTAKNKTLLSAGTVKQFDPSIIPTLTPGDIVYKDGRLQKFLGVNNTGYQCEQDAIPTATGFVASIPENTVQGTLIGTVTGTEVNDFYFSAPSPFRLDPSTGNVYLSGTLDYTKQSSYSLAGTAVNDNGNHTNFTVTINITEVNTPPQAPSAEVTISDASPSGTQVYSMKATDREGNTLLYSITGGNSQGAFAINAQTGMVSVADSTQLNGMSVPAYQLTITVSDGNSTGTGTLTIHIIHENEPPVISNITLTIPDTTSGGTLIYTLPMNIDPEGDPVLYAIVNESVPGQFTVDTTSGNIALAQGIQLNPAVVNQYILYLSVTDGLHSAEPFTVTINIIYNRSSIGFSPDGGSCNTMPSCPEGWTLSPDGTTCTLVSTQPPSITQQNSCLAASTNGAYTDNGARIYNPGFVNEDIGTYTPNPGDIYAVMDNSFWTSIGNQIGVWVDTNCDGIKDSLSQGTSTTILYNYNNVGTARTVYAGVIGDNQFILKVNDQKIAATTQAQSQVNFKLLHLFPVMLTNGQNLFNVVGTGDGSINDAVGLIIFDNTAAQLQAATSMSQLNTIFSSESLIGTNSTIATCPDGYVLDDNGGSPVCKKIENQPPTITTGNLRSWSRVKISDVLRGTTINTVNNQAGGEFQDMTIPFYPPMPNSDECGGTSHLYLSATKSGQAQKNDCSTGTGETITYSVPEGSYYSAVSQQAADEQAQNDVNTNVQNYANQNGDCL